MWRWVSEILACRWFLQPKLGFDGCGQAIGYRTMGRGWSTHEMFSKTSPSHVLCLSLGWFWHCHVGFWGVWWDMVRYGSRMLLVTVFWSQLFAMIQLSLAFGGAPWLPGQEYGRNWSSLCGGLWDLEDVRGSTVHLQGRTKNMLMAKAQWHLIPLGRWRSMYGKLNW
jgi:hypothetical protein